MADIDVQLDALAGYLVGRRDAILQAWRDAIKTDPALATGNALPRVDLYDHIPALLRTFERRLRDRGLNGRDLEQEAEHKSAAAHGLQRWQQGYDLREVTRELGKLNQCVVSELEDYVGRQPHVSHEAMAAARQVWAALCTTGIEESVGQYFLLQQQEALGHVKDLESGMLEIQDLERQRADLWRQAAHDLRGNLGVVANVTVGLTHRGLQESSRDDFVRILMRNVTSLHHLLDDVTSLARLQAGRERRNIEPLDVSSILQQMCEGITPMAQQRGIYLRCEGPAGFATDGDAVKIRRIAQNLVLNALKVTREGGITVSWGDSSANDPKRWELCIADTGPGFPQGSGQPLKRAFEKAHDQSPGGEAAAAGEKRAEQRDEQQDEQRAEQGTAAEHARLDMSADRAPPEREPAGEGIGLSIVKRLCDMLDATIDMTSERDVGTKFRILFPRKYAE
ncbi:MAG: sensor histidine kinase [Gammaproteobacteria bacterium]